MATKRGGPAEWQRQQQAAEREHQRRLRAAEATARAAQKEERRRHLEKRAAAVERKSAKVADRVAELSSILVTGVARRARVDLRALRKQVTVPPLDLGDLAEPAPEPDWQHFAPRTPRLSRFLPVVARRHEERVTDARSVFDRAVRRHRESEAERHRKITALRGKHADDQRWQERNVTEHNKTVDEWIRGLPRREQGAVEAYLREVLVSTPLPKKFPRHIDVTFNPKAEQAVVRVELPPRDVVPQVRGYQYVQTKDEERPLPRPAKEVGELYRSVVSQVALLFVRDLFDADRNLTSVGSTATFTPRTRRRGSANSPV